MKFVKQFEEKNRRALCMSSHRSRVHEPEPPRPIYLFTLHSSLHDYPRFLSHIRTPHTLLTYTYKASFQTAHNFVENADTFWYGLASGDTFGYAIIYSQSSEKLNSLNFV